MASLMDKVTRFARSPKGRSMTDKAVKAAKDPKNQERARDARRRFGRKR